MIDEWTQQIHEGDSVELLRQMPESSVHMAMCSPPYYGLRDYGVEGQIGLEESLEEYVQSLVAVGRELHRVLRPDGNWWLNLGDTFAGGFGVMGKPDRDDLHHDEAYPDEPPARHSALGRKNKMMVPHRVAIALQESGWVVRSDSVWSKPNPLPHPVKDRLTETKEFLFHLTPEPDYWFDLDSIREPHKEQSVERAARYDFRASVESKPGDIYPDRPDGSEPHNFKRPIHPDGKNPGDVLEIAVRAFPEAHFAVYPPELCETPIKSSCPPKVCSECGTPYRRDTTEVPLWERSIDEVTRDQQRRALELYQDSDLTVEHLEACRAVGFMDAGQGAECQTGYNRDETERLAREAKDVLGGYFREFCGPLRRDEGFRKACECDTSEWEPGVVLDPFAGAGTTCLVAKELGRQFMGIDLNPEYVAMAQARVGVTVDEPEYLTDDAQATLADGGFTSLVEPGREDGD